LRLPSSISISSAVFAVVDDSQRRLRPHNVNVNSKFIETLRKNEETRLDACEMKGPRQILWVSWTAKKAKKTPNQQRQSTAGE